MINLTPEAYRQALESPILSEGMKSMVHRRLSGRASEFRQSAHWQSGWNLTGDDTYSVPTPDGDYGVTMKQVLDEAGLVRGIMYQVASPSGVVVVEATEDLEVPQGKVAELLNGVVALCRPLAPWGQMSLADVRARHALAWNRRGVEYELQTFGWAKTDLGFTREIGGAMVTPENPDGLRTVEVRLAEDMSVAEFFFGDQKAAWVPLERGSLLKDVDAIENTASSMDSGFVRPEPDPLPDNFSPYQLVEYLHSRYGDRFGRIQRDHLYEVRTESWEGICAMQTERHLAEVYIPSFTRDFPSGEVCGVYHRRQESGSGWDEKTPVICDPGTEESWVALDRARRLGVELPGDEPWDKDSIRQTVKKAKMAM